MKTIDQMDHLDLRLALTIKESENGILQSRVIHLEESLRLLNQEYDELEKKYKTLIQSVKTAI